MLYIQRTLANQEAQEEAKTANACHGREQIPEGVRVRADNRLLLDSVRHRPNDRSVGLGMDCDADRQP